MHGVNMMVDCPAKIQKAIIQNVSASDKKSSNTNEETDKIYLDYNATTPIDRHVIESMSVSLAENWHNPSSQSAKGKLAKKLINDARRSLASMINAENESDIILMSGGTEANNVVFHSALKHYESFRKRAVSANIEANPLPHIVISNIEHDSVKLIGDYYRRENLAEITEVQVGSHGLLKVEDIVAAIKLNTILISIMLANNETGVILPVGELTRRLDDLGLLHNENLSANRYCPLFVHTDAAQAIGKINVNVVELKCDYLTIVGHKFYGPRIGALYARNCGMMPNDDAKYKIAPIYHMFMGAGQEVGLRPGTENTACIIGLGRAAQLVVENLTHYTNHMKQTRDYLEMCLIKEFGADNLVFNSKSAETTRLPNTCNVSFKASNEFKGYLILENCKRLEASTGSCCHSGELKPSKILLAMKISHELAANALRISVGRETTTKQIDEAIADLKQALNNLTHA